jgi:ankyrin repeat protein
MRGDFVFRTAVVDPPFTFHDDDQSVAIADIPLDPAQRSDGAGPADPHLRARLDQIRGADEVQIDDKGSGMGERSRKRYVLRRPPPGVTKGAIPAAVLDAFLGGLASAPVLNRPYRPRLEHTDDYPYLSITVGKGEDRVVVFSESQGVERIPWALQTDGRRYLIPSDAPARAFDLVRAYLPVNEVQVDPRAPNEMPPPGGRAARAYELRAATQRGEVAEVRRLLAAGADPVYLDDETGESAVHVAAAAGRADLIALFADFGVVLDTADYRGFTPLVAAAVAGHLDVVRLLLQRGVRSDLGEALIQAALAGRLEIVQALVGAGAPVEGHGLYGVTALMCAAGARGVPHLDILKLLLDSGAPVNAAANDGGTALHILAESTSRPLPGGVGVTMQAVRMLMAAGADPRQKDREGRSVLDVLEAAHTPESREILAAIR